MTDLLEVLPDLCLPRLDPENEQIRIVAGEHHKALNIDELLERISTMCSRSQGVS